MHKRTFLQAATMGALSLALPCAQAQAGGENRIAKSRQIPQQASLAGTDSNGKAVDLGDYAGKVCLVSFFTSGCNLCSNDLKLMREFYLGNKARNFVLLGVNIDDSRADFMQYMNLIALSVPAEQRFPIVWRNAPGHRDSFGAIAKKPTHFVLDRNHRQALRREGSFQPSDWDDLWTALG